MSSTCRVTGVSSPNLARSAGALARLLVSAFAASMSRRFVRVLRAMTAILLRTMPSTLCGAQSIACPRLAVTGVGGVQR